MEKTQRRRYIYSEKVKEKKKEKVLRDQDTRDAICKLEDPGCYFVTAPAGTGKTQCLADSVANAILSGCDPSKMLCVTYTDKAAKEMRNRVKDRYEELSEKESRETLSENELDAVLDKMHIGTLHSFCRRYMSKGNTSYTILDQEEIGWIVGDKKRTVLDVINYAAKEKLERVNPEKEYFTDHFSKLLKDEKALLLLKNKVQKYNKYKKEHECSDFNDILIDAYDKFRQETPRFEPPKFDRIFVDEAQDFNELQHDIVKCLTGKQTMCCYYGDLNQAIYSFMGSSPDSLKQMQNEADGGHRFLLEVNCRSQVRMAEMFKTYVSKTLLSSDDATPASEAVPGLTLVECSDSVSEQNFVAGKVKEILELCKTKSFYREHKPSVAILVRGNADADKISDTLTANYIPHLQASGARSGHLAAFEILTAHFGVVNDEMNIRYWARILYQLRCSTTLRSCNWLIRRLLGCAILPSDIMNMEDGKKTLLATFLDAAKNEDGVCLMRKDKDCCISMVMRAKDGSCTESSGNDFSELRNDIGKRPILMDNSQMEIESFVKENKITDAVISLRRLNDLLRYTNMAKSNDYAMENDNGDNRREELIARFERLLEVGEKVIKRQEEFMSHGGFIMLERKINIIYKPIWRNTVETLNNDSPNNEKDTGTCDFFRRKKYTGTYGIIVKAMMDAIKAFRKKGILYDNIPAIPDGAQNEETKNKLREFVAKRSYTIFNYLMEYLASFIDRDKNKDAQMTPMWLLATLMHHLRGITVADFSDPDQKIVKEKVWVMTVHQAKGLGFTDVFVTGASSDRYYTSKRRGVSENERHEPSRIFYVAITRAKKNLTLTYFRREFQKHKKASVEMTSVTPFAEPVLDFFRQEKFPGQKKISKDNG